MHTHALVLARAPSCGDLTAADCSGWRWASSTSFTVTGTSRLIRDAMATIQDMAYAQMMRSPARRRQHKPPASAVSGGACLGTFVLSATEPLVLADEAAEDRPALDPSPGSVGDRVVGAEGRLRCGRRTL